MGRLNTYGRGILMGMKMGLAPTGAGSLKVAGVETTAHAARVCRELARETRSKPCLEVAGIVEHNAPSARQYQLKTRGTMRFIPRSGENRCRSWLNGYYLYIAEILEGESEDIRETSVLPDVPKIPDIIPDIPSLPGLPDTGGIKRSLQVTGIVVMGFIALIVYLVFARGGAGRDVTVGKVG